MSHISRLLLILAVVMILSPVKAAASAVTAVYPNGGEVFHVGDLMTIRFTADNTSTSFRIFILIRGGETTLPVVPDPIYKTDYPDWGKYTWEIPDSFTVFLNQTYSMVDSACYIEINDAYNTQGPQVDHSDHAFIILPRADGVEATVAGRVGNFRVFPNPSRGPVTVMFNSGSRGPRSAFVYDPAGRLLESLPAFMNGPVSWQPRALSAGVYFLEVRDGLKSYRKGIQIIR
jgi:hypothetical protein